MWTKESLSAEEEKKEEKRMTTSYARKTLFIPENRSWVYRRSLQFRWVLHVHQTDRLERRHRERYHRIGRVNKVPCLIRCSQQLIGLTHPCWFN